MVSSVTRPARAERLPVFGREGDVRRIRGALGSEGGGALLLSGDMGIGKSAVLDAVAEGAVSAGTRVLRAGGAEFEAGVGYSGLNQVLLPVRSAIDALQPPFRENLRVALGFGVGQVPDPLVVANATLALLSQVAEDAPLLLIVDDLHWIDPASASALGFVARRLSGGRLSFLAACRSRAGTCFAHGGPPEYELPPLHDASAAALLGERFPGLPARVRRRLLTVARGNPLALLELPTSLAPGCLGGTEDVPDVLPLSRRLQELFVSRVTALPALSQRLLLLAALEGAGDLAVLEAAASGSGTGGGLEGLEPAERDRLVDVDEHAGQLSFRHPLTRSAAVEAATSSERRTAHRALAHVLADRPERRAWHLGEAAVGPDEAVAGLLEAAADRMKQRGDAMGAVRALARSVDLSPPGPERVRRLAEAAYLGAETAGALDSASHLLAEARRSDPLLRTSARFAAAAAQVVLNGDSDLDTAHRLVVAAVEEGSHGYDAGDESLIDALHLLLLLAYFSGEASRFEPLYAALDRLRPGPPLSLAVTASTLGDPARRGAAVLDEMRLLLARTRGETDAVAIVRAGAAAIYPDRLTDLREPVWRVLSQGRERSPGRPHLGALFQLALDDCLTGRWEEAAELAREGLRVCEETGYAFFTWYFRSLQALLAAMTGDFERSHALADRIARWAAPRGVGAALHYANHARTVADLGTGDYEAAYRHASAVSPLGTLASHVPHALWVAMDAVEAAVRTGRSDEAAAHVRALRASDAASLSPRLALLADGAAALCAPDHEALRIYETALAAPGLDRWCFCTARVRLAHGERLRRVRSTSLARAELHGALEAFRKLGARPWAERAEMELRAMGRAPRAGAFAASALTPQESEIARLAASGLTNKQIGQRLYLSHRTVGAHLYQIYPKLGITSRTMLRDALDAQEPGPYA